MPDGTERPIGFASRSLSVAQRNYSQLEKEALAIVFGVQRFHSYLVGHHFELVTDFYHIFYAGVYFCTLVHSISFIYMYISLFFCCTQTCLLDSALLHDNVTISSVFIFAINCFFLSTGDKISGYSVLRPFLSKQGHQPVKVQSDENCLFHAISVAFTGTPAATTS